MRKLLLLLSITILSTVASAQYTYQIVLRNAAAPNSGTSANIIGSGAAFHNLTWNVGGTVSTCSVRVDGSADGITWGTGDVIGATTCTSNGNTLSASHIVNYVRINLVTFTGTLPVFTANVSGYITQPSGGGTVTSITCGTGLSGGTITSTGTCALTTPVTVANGGTGASTLTIHGVVLGNTTSAVNVTAAGTTGQVLTGVTGADPVWGAASGGALVQLETHAASSSASLAYTGCINNSSYKTFEVLINNLVPSTSGDSLWLQFSTDGGSTYDTTNLYSYANFVQAPAGSGSVQSNATSGMDLANSTATTASYPGVNGILHIFSPAGTSLFKAVTGDFFGLDTVGDGRKAERWMLGGMYQNTAAVTAFRVVTGTSGTVTHNIASGTVTCYGVTP